MPRHTSPCVCAPPRQMRGVLVKAWAFLVLQWTECFRAGRKAARYQAGGDRLFEVATRSNIRCCSNTIVFISTISPEEII